MLWTHLTWHTPPMRWERLFADLEAQLTAAEQAELAGEISDRTRRELARVRLVDRLREAEGTSVDVGLGAAGTVTGRVARVGVDWLLLDRTPGATETLVPLMAVTTLRGLGARSAARDSGGRVFARTGLGHALRAVARDRAQVSVLLRDGGAVAGVVDRVGEDHLDLVERAAGEPRRPGAAAGARTVSLAAIAAVRSLS